MTDLNAQIEQARQRLKDLQAKAQKQYRKDETRRKIILGAAVLRLLRDSEGDKADRLLKLLEERVTRASDKAFLNL
ncbi:hypothetical protein [Shimia thalassica]|uniref:hypothetical protein n=1 Tax=Shimia thalassica TaxID=1715693 RepID=UPI002735F0C7|nr:hypothetical protein [Shimia thalassica]MDP2520122.1 hypothetical protein [Shimia thalassica]